MKGMQLGREEVKLSLFINDIILYIDKSKESTKRLFDLINSLKFQYTNQYKNQ
jgi:hypothetical protein